MYQFGTTGDDMNMLHYYRNMRNRCLEYAEKWREMAIRFKRNGNTHTAIIAARQYRKNLREALRYETLLKG